MNPRFSEPVAIVGMGCVFPGAHSVADFWTLLQSGRTTFMPTPGQLWQSDQFYSNDRSQPDKYYDDIVSYPHGFDTPSDLSRLAHYIRTALAECLGGVRPAQDRLKVFAGSTGVADGTNAWLMIDEIERSLQDRISAPHDRADLREALCAAIYDGPDTQPLSARLSSRIVEDAILSVTGRPSPYVLIDAACASSLFSVDAGIQALSSGECDLAVCGGFFSSNPSGKVLFCRLGGSSAHGVFPFEARADGTVFGEGAGFVALKRVSQAVAAGDYILAVIPAVGLSGDGKGKSIYAPNARGQVLAMRRAYAQCGIDPATIQFVEAHGTGTHAGDATEFASLCAFFGPGDPTRSLAMGSVKAVFGHLGWAAGVASIIKLVLCLKHGQLPGQPRLEARSPSLDWDHAPFDMTDQTTPWQRRGEEPRRACINGFGFGGANAHLILEEHLPAAPAPLSDLSVGDTGPLCVVGVGCYAPGCEGWDALRSVLDGRAAPLTRRFAPDHKVANIKFRLIDRSAAVIDRSQFFLLEACDQILRSQPAFAGLKAETSVFVAQAGSVQRQIEEMKRIYADAVTSQVSRHPRLGMDSDVANAVAAWYADVKARIAPPNEDSNPGVMPNVAAGRVSNWQDLHGPCMAVDAGLGSFSQALHLAKQSLVFGRSRLALVGVANANVLTAHDDLWRQLTGRDDADLAEGGLCLGLMLYSQAVARGVEVLATLDTAATADGAADLDLDCGPADGSRLGNYFSAPDVEPLLQAVHNAGKGETTSLAVRHSSFGVTCYRVSSPQIAKSRSDDYFLLGGRFERDGHGLTAVREISLETDGYLDDHTVGGKATLPGTFSIEWAAEAASALVPQLQVVEIQDAEFLKFIRPPMTCRLRATASDRGAQAVVTVEITTDIVSKGIVLRRDVPCFRCRVVMGVPSKAPRFAFAAGGDYSPVADPYYLPGAAVHLRGAFRTFESARRNGRYVVADYKNRVRQLPEAFAGFVLAPTLLDGLLRLGILGADADDTLVPTRIGVIRIHRALNEFALRAAYDSVTGVDDADTRTRYLVDPDMNVLCEISHIQAVATRDSVLSSPVASASPATKPGYRHVFLTGATGFLGSHLLTELLRTTGARVTCLVRAPGQAVGRARLISVLTSAGPWNESFSSRLEVVVGNLDKDRLGLSDGDYQTVCGADHIFHCAARISFLESTDQLFETNVNACRRVVELARAGGGIPIAYTSTVAVFYSGQDDRSSVTESDRPRAASQDVASGYTGTKILAEEVMREAHAAGLPVTIFRCGVIVRDVAAGDWDKQYFHYKLLQTFLQSRSAFADDRNHFDMTPVDYVVQAMIYLSEARRSDDLVYHLSNPHAPSFRQLIATVNELGAGVAVTDAGSWWSGAIAAATQEPDHPLAAFAPRFAAEDDTAYRDFRHFIRIDCERTRTALRDSGTACPPMDAAFLKGFVDAMGAGHELPEAPAGFAAMLGFADHATQRLVPYLADVPLPEAAGASGDQAWLVFSYQDRHGLLAATASQGFDLEGFRAGRFDARLASDHVLLQIDIADIALPDIDPDAFLAQVNALTEGLFHIARVSVATPHRLAVILQTCRQGDVLHPATGMIRGLIRGLSKENSAKSIKVILTDDPLTSAVLSAELAAPPSDPVVVYTAGNRQVYRLRQDAPLLRGSANALPDNPVFVLSGGGRGIGGHLALDIARSVPDARLVILGRQDPEISRADIAEVVSRYGSLTQSAYLDLMRPSLKTPADARAAMATFKRLRGHEKVLKTLDALTATGCAYRYIACDVTQEAQVAAAMARVYADFGRIDVVVHCAGLEGSGLLARKTWAEFRYVFDCKVTGFINLAKHIRADEVAQWINFGSMVSFYGNDGQVDYCAANDGLNTLSGYYSQRFAQGRHYTLNWPGWDEVGMLDDYRHVRDVLLSRGFIPMRAVEGSAWFAKELLAGPRSANQVYYFHQSELDFFHKVQPVFDPHIAGHTYHARPTGPRQWEVTIEMSLDRHPYLETAARYRGVPVLPGSFQLELALGAVNRVAPLPAACRIDFLDVRFLKVPKFLHRSIDLVMRVTETAAGRWDVELTTSVVRKGITLTTLRHSQLTIEITAAASPPQGGMEASSGEVDPAIPAVLYRDASPLHLGRYFNNVGAAVIDGNARRSAYAVPFALPPEHFAGHLICPLAIDAALQTCLARVGAYVEVLIPESLGRLTLFAGPVNDLSLQSRFGALSILTQVNPGTTGATHIQVMSEDNAVLFEVADFVATGLGYIHAGTGAHVALPPAAETVQQVTLAVPDIEIAE